MNFYLISINNYQNIINENILVVCLTLFEYLFLNSKAFITFIIVRTTVANMIRIDVITIGNAFPNGVAPTELSSAKYAVYTTVLLTLICLIGFISLRNMGPM